MTEAPKTLALEAYASQGDVLNDGNPYKGSDFWSMTTLDPGDRIVQIEWRPEDKADAPYSRYFTSIDELETHRMPDGRVDIAALTERLQVMAHGDQYNAFVSVYEVTETMEVATARITDNPAFGQGGAVQYFTPEGVRNGEFLEKVDHLHTANRDLRLPIYENLEALEGADRSDALNAYRESHLDALVISGDEVALDVADGMTRRQLFSDDVRALQDTPERLDSLSLPENGSTILDLDPDIRAKVDAAQKLISNVSVTSPNIGAVAKTLEDTAPVIDAPAVENTRHTQPVPFAREILSGTYYVWAKPGHLAGLVGPDGQADGVSWPSQGEPVGVIGRMRSALAPEPPGMSVRELTDALRETSREVAALDSAGEGMRGSPQGWRLGHPETAARAAELANGARDGSLSDMRVAIDLTGPDGAPLSAHERADALCDGLDKASSVQARATGHTPSALSGPLQDYTRAHPVPGSEEALIARGEPAALSRQAVRETTPQQATSRSAQTAQRSPEMEGGRDMG